MFNPDDGAGATVSVAGSNKYGVSELFRKSQYKTLPVGSNCAWTDRKVMGITADHCPITSGCALAVGVKKIIPTSKNAERLWGGILDVTRWRKLFAPLTGWGGDMEHSSTLRMYCTLPSCSTR
jgi:hypothetical protein